jgi:hypothetical protein
MWLDDLADALFSASPAFRYVAYGSGQQVEMRSRGELANSSSGDSDRYEELLVNPTLLKLATQRGDLDCGGLGYVLVRYGHFFQLVVPLTDGGHLSVAIEPAAHPVELVETVIALARQHGKTPAGPG